MLYTTRRFVSIHIFPFGLPSDVFAVALVKAVLLRMKALPRQDHPL
jgi:hypothetical protein